MRLGSLEELRYGNRPKTGIQLPVRRRDVGQEDVSVRVRVQRRNTRLELSVDQEAARLDLNWVGTQRSNPADVQIESQIDEGKRYRRHTGGTKHGGRGQLVFRHGPELRIAQAENPSLGVILAGRLPQRHTDLTSVETIKTSARQDSDHDPAGLCDRSPSPDGGGRSTRLSSRRA